MQSDGGGSDNLERRAALPTYAKSIASGTRVRESVVHKYPNMRIEQPQFFLYSGPLFAFAWVLTKSISSARCKLHLRTISLALGLGFVVVQGHGEFIVAPLLACFSPPLRSHLIVLGSVYFTLWWAIYLRLLKT